MVTASVVICNLPRINKRGHSELPINLHTNINGVRFTGKINLIHKVEEKIQKEDILRFLKGLADEVQLTTVERIAVK